MPTKESNELIEKARVCQFNSFQFTVKEVNFYVMEIEVYLYS